MREHTAKSTQPYIAFDAVGQFRNAIADSGLTPPDHIQADGQLHRYSTNGKGRDNAGWYVLHTDGVAAGMFGCWRSGIQQTWCAKKSQDFSPEESKSHADKVRRMKDQRRQEKQDRNTKAAKLAITIWGNSKPVQSHPYLSTKNVTAHGLREYEGRLVVPLRDTAGAIHSLQFIDQDGNKRFLPGGAISGNYFAIDGIKERLLVCEGLATGLSLYEATGQAVAVAFNAGNLQPVAERLRSKHADIEIVICGDNDAWTEGNPGLTKAKEVAEAVGALCVIPEFKDTSDKPTDFNDLSNLEGVERVKEMIRESKEPVKSEESKQQPNTASICLVDLVLNQDVGLWHDPDGVAYATVKVNNHQEHWPLRSRSFRSWLAGELWKTGKRVASSQAMQDTLAVLEGYAVHEGEAYEVHVHLAEHSGNVYLDLCDEEWRVVEITSTGWAVTNNPPVRFRRTKGMRALPIPEKGGNLDELRRFVNVSNEEWPLVKGWLVGCFNVKGPHAGLAYGGEHGSGKTTATKVLKRLIDPSQSDLRSPPRNTQDLMIAANNSWVVGYDNLSSLRSYLSDDLARLATGSGFSTRTLYENDEETLFSACRPVLLNGIEDVVTRPDLMDRFIVIRAPRIEDTKRRDEADLWQKFEAVRPRMLGALLTSASKALHDLPNVKLDEQPRMLDFAKFVVAAESDEDKGRFLKAYIANRRDAQDMAIDADLVAQAILRHIEKARKWTGTAQELAKLLLPDNVPKEWPTTGQKMAGVLRRAAPALRAKGLEVEHNDKDRPRTWTLQTSDATDATDATRINTSDAPRHLSVTSRQFPKQSDGLKPPPNLDPVTSVTSVTCLQGHSSQDPSETDPGRTQEVI